MFFYVHPRVYCVMHSTLALYRERAHKLPPRGESKKREEETSQKEGKGVTVKTKHVKSLESI